MSINAAERDETEGTMEALANDGTGTWSAINNGLANTTVHALVITPTNPIAILAGTYGGVFKSGDGGGTWSVNSRLMLLFLPWLSIPHTPAAFVRQAMVYMGVTTME